MPFERVWDKSCPREYDRWEADGATWVIQDLLPEDDEEALRLLLEQMAPDEALCTASRLCEDELSMRSMGNNWRKCLSKRMTLACYVYKNNTRTIAALNVCLVVCRDEKEDFGEIEGEAWINVHSALHYAATKVNVFDVLGMDRVLYAMGLLVQRDYRGAQLGARMLAARKPLSLAHGIKGTSTVFTGIGSQRSAERAGFTTVANVTFKELVDAGLKYPLEDKSIKLMIKKYDS